MPHRDPPVLRSVLLLALLCCLQPALAAGTVKPLAFAHAIPDESIWHALAARPQSAATARTEVVKFLLDVKDGRTLWFTNSVRYPVHYYFALEHIPHANAETRDHDAFNRIQYRDEARRFEMGSIVHYLDSDQWTLELVSGDTLSGERIAKLFQSVRAALWTGDRLRFRPMSQLHENAVAHLVEPLPLATADEVFAGIRYQPLTTGTAFGFLRLVKGPLDPTTVRADEILVLETLPDEIPVSAAVISRELQAPLGHIAILCATRGTPNMALRDALELPDLRALDGKLVALAVNMQDFSVRAATRAEAEKAWTKRRPKRPQVPALLAKETRLLDVAQLHLADTRFAGAKASQLGEVMRLGDLITPGGFVIPLSYYLDHLRATGAAADLAAQLADPAFNEDTVRRAHWLASVRAQIAGRPVDPGLVKRVRERIQQIAPGSRWILRSSTNAEDLAGFTGAGLYRSIRVKAGADDAQIARAISEVWASVWLQGAFEERAWYRVDHAAVGMAILVQPFVDGALANGVAITANPFTETQPGFFINAQPLGGSVTGAGGDEVPEQHLVYTYSGEFESELLSHSSRMGGVTLLGEADLRALTAALDRLHEHFMRKWKRRANAVDVEFLIAGLDRHVVILQARPFRVTYSRGQRIEDVAPIR
jgi:rifampicin phosphotransferase